ncbi:MAG TPA: hypothetical protein VF763_14845 [Candidatus Limnocylindrales bacterium]
MRPLARLVSILALAALVLGPSAALAATADPASGGGARLERAAFHDAMRKLWEDHITWTRLFIVSEATEPAALPDLGPTADRLLANQVDIGDAIRPFYGDAAGARLTALLREHILLAARLLEAAKAGDSPGAAADSTAWYANANEIAAFLHAANPRHWALADLQAMMKSHLDLTLAEAVARLQGRYADDIAAYDRVHAEILSMADMLSDGIIAQFPSRFAP